MEQQEMRLGLQVVPEQKEVPDWMVATCKTLRQAFQLCLRESVVRRSDEEWARVFGKTPAEFSLIVYGDRNPRPGKQPKIRWLPDAWLEEVEGYAGNLVITQWFAMRKRRKLASETDVEREERALRQRLSELQRLKGAA